MEKTFEYDIKSCTLIIEGSEYKNLEKAFDAISDANISTAGITECLQCILDFVSLMLDRKRYVLPYEGKKNPNQDKQQCETSNVSEDNGGCVKVTLRLKSESDVSTISKAEAITSAFTPYVANWSTIVNRIINNANHQATLAKCMPKNMAEIMVKELNTLPGVTASYE